MSVMLIKNIYYVKAYTMYENVEDDTYRAGHYVDVFIQPNYGTIMS